MTENSHLADSYGFSTAAIHADATEQLSAVPIYMTVTAQGRYTRDGNPTTDAFEAQVARLEGGEASLSTACGVSAITQTLLTLLGSGDRVICHRSVYTWVEVFMREEAERLNIDAVMMDLRDQDALRAALRTKTSVVYFEPLANSSMDVIDVETTARIAHEAGATVVADNTFLSPYLMRPLALGADVVVHSATKYLSGHGDVMGGVVTSSRALIERVWRTRNIYGGILSPFNAYLLLRGMQTLAVRVEQHCRNAARVADFLAGHPSVSEVRYPGLATHPGHAIAARQWRGFGGMIGFRLAGGAAQWDRFVARVQVARPWVSLGDTKTLTVLRKVNEPAGVPEGYVRLSVGLEDVDDIIADLDQALRA